MNKEQERFIIENWDKMSVRKLRNVFNSKFNTDYKETAFHYHTNRLGLRKFNSMHRYTKEQDEFLKNNSSKMDRQELTVAFNKQFDLSIDVQAITARCCKNGWSSSTNGKFKPGFAPWQKSVSKEYYMNQRKNAGYKNCWAKGHTPLNIREIGSERICRNGKKYIKMKNPNVWKSVSQVAWEKENGEIPGNMHIISVNGNVNETDTKNLRLVTNAEKMLLVSNEWHDKGAEIFDSGLQYAKLYFALRASGISRAMINRIGNETGFK